MLILPLLLGQAVMKWLQQSRVVFRDEWAALDTLVPQIFKILQKFFTNFSGRSHLFDSSRHGQNKDRAAAAPYGERIPDEHSSRRAS